MRIYVTDVSSRVRVRHPRPPCCCCYVDGEDGDDGNDSDDDKCNDVKLVTSHTVIICALATYYIDVHVFVCAPYHIICV